MSDKTDKNNEVSLTKMPVSLSSPANALIHKFEHEERLKAEAQVKERSKTTFAKKTAKFEVKENTVQTSTEVNRKAKMFVDIANKDPKEEIAERERKTAFEKKKLGFQKGTVKKDHGDAQRKEEDDQKHKEQSKREFEEKSSVFKQSNEETHLYLTTHKNNNQLLVSCSNKHYTTNPGREHVYVFM